MATALPPLGATVGSCPRTGACAPVASAARWPRGSIPFPIRAVLDRLNMQPQLRNSGRQVPAEMKPCAVASLALTSSGLEAAEDHSHIGDPGQAVSRQRSGDSAAEGDVQVSGSAPSACSTAPTDFELDLSYLSRERVVRGRVWFLAQDPKGCRCVQEALETAGCEEVKLSLAFELKGHIVHALRCPHANHVLQKCIATMQPESLQFIVEEVTARSGLVAQASRHRYGCRIVQQLLKKCRPQQVHVLAEVLLADATAFSCHPFGSYVMQQLMEHGTEDQQHRLIRAIEGNLATIVHSASGCGVISAAIKHGGKEDLVWLARGILQEPRLLRTLAHARHGNNGVVLLLQKLQDNEQDCVRSELFADIVALRASRYGRSVADHLEPGSDWVVDVAVQHCTFAVQKVV